MLPTYSLLFSLFGGAATAVNLYATHYSGTISHLTFDNHSLELVSSAKTGQALPSWITYDAAGKKLYIPDENFIDEDASGVLVSYSVNADGTLTKAGNATTPRGGVATTLYGGKDGRKFMATAHYQASQLSTYKLPLNGKKSLQTLKWSLKGPGANPDRQDAPHPHHTFVDPTGHFLLVTDLGADLIRINKINKKTGKLTECPPAVAVRGSGPRHGTFWTSPHASSRVQRGTGKGAKKTILFVTNELTNTVTGWKASYPRRGCLTLKAQQSLTPYKGNASAPVNATLAEIRIKDNFLYASTREDAKFAPNDSITQYTISDKGVLSWTDITSSYGTVPRTFDINKAGDYVAIGDQRSENVAIVKRDPKTGKLGKRVAELKITGKTVAKKDDDIPTGLTAVVWAE